MTEQSNQRPLPVPTDVSQPFWDAAKEHRLVFQYCREAGRFQHYPRSVSVYTGMPTLEWREVEGRGFIYAVTVTHRGPPAFRGTEPYVVATMQLDEGVRIVSNIVNCNPDDVRVGQRVKLFWLKMDEQFNYPLFEPDNE
jgi:uncharacterized protein